MLKTTLNFLAGALVAAAVGAVFAATGTPPGTGPQLIDGAWLNGLAGGQNYTFQAGITAHSGGTQAACLNLTPGTWMYEVDTVGAAGDSICLPFAVAGNTLVISNAATTNSMNIFAQPGTNALTGTTDTINNVANATAYALTAANNVDCFVAKNGLWKCARGN